VAALALVAVAPRRRTLAARWQAFEAQIFALVFRAEAKLLRHPPGTRIVPSAFDRQVVRLCLGVIVAVLGVLIFLRGPARQKAYLIMLAVVFVAVLVMLARDAFPTKRR
jgi:uncharacterized membrane protein YedE/YeeE